MRIRGRTAQAVRLDGPRARGRDAGTRPARGVVDTETGGDRRGMPQGRARARETGRALAIGAVVRVNGGAKRTWKTRLRGRGDRGARGGRGRQRGRIATRRAFFRGIGTREERRRSRNAETRARAHQSVGGRRRGGHARRDASKRSRSESTNALATPRTLRRRPAKWRCASGSRTDGLHDSSRSYCWYRSNFCFDTSEL